MLIDHAEPERMRIPGIGDRLLAAADQHGALRPVVVAHDAFHERGFPGSVLAEQRVERPRPHLQLDIVERGEIAEPHRYRDGLAADRLRMIAVHDSASISAAEVATAPNTPPCILIIFSA